MANINQAFIISFPYLENADRKNDKTLNVYFYELERKIYRTY